MERSTRGTGVYVSQAWIGSNLADMGRERCVPSLLLRVGNSWVGFGDRPGDHGECCGVAVVMPQGQSRAPPPSSEITVNTGTVLVLPFSRASGPEGSAGRTDRRSVQDGAEPS